MILVLSCPESPVATVCCKYPDLGLVPVIVHDYIRAAISEEPPSECQLGGPGRSNPRTDAPPLYGITCFTDRRYGPLDPDDEF